MIHTDTVGPVHMIAKVDILVNQEKRERGSGPETRVDGRLHGKVFKTNDETGISTFAG